MSENYDTNDQFEESGVPEDEMEEEEFYEDDHEEDMVISKQYDE